LINKDVTPARRLRLNAFFQRVGKKMFPNEWDESEAASLKPQASRTADEKLHAAQKRGADVDEESWEQLLGGSIKIAVDLEWLGKLIPPSYRDEKAQNAQLSKQYFDECKRLNQPIDFVKGPKFISIVDAGEYEVFDSLELLIGEEARNYYEIRIDRIDADCIDWSTGKINVERDAIDVNWDFLECSGKEIVPHELNNLGAWIVDPDAALSLFTLHETPSSNAKQPTRVTHDWNNICGLMWRCLAIEKPLSDEFSLQSHLQNTVADALACQNIPAPAPSQLKHAAQWVLGQYARSDMAESLRPNFSRRKSAKPDRKS
jgi:hypothetical protein